MKNFPKFYSDDLRNLVNNLLVIDPIKRPTFNQIGNYKIFGDDVKKLQINSNSFKLMNKITHMKL